MGYAGYVPAKMPPAKPTEVEAAVQAVKSLEALEVMGKLLYNCAVSPREEKFRRIKLSNKKISEVLVGTTGEAAAGLAWQVVCSGSRVMASCCNAASYVGP